MVAHFEGLIWVLRHSSHTNFEPMKPQLLADPELRKEFLDNLRMFHTIQAACLQTGVTYRVVQSYRKTNPEFDEEVRSALNQGFTRSGPVLVQTAIERATVGFLQPVYKRGWKPINVIGLNQDEILQEATQGENVEGYKLLPPSDALLIRLLEAYVPEFKRQKPEVNVALNMGNEDFLEKFVDTAYQSLRAAGQSVDKAKLRDSVLNLLVPSHVTESDAVS